MIELSVSLSSYKVGVRRGVRLASQHGVDGVLLPCPGSELDPDQLTWTGRQEVKSYVQSHGLRIVGLWGEEGGFTDPEVVERRVERAKQIVSLAFDLRCPIVTSWTGTLPDDERDISWRTAAEALEEIANYAIYLEVRWAVETGQEPPDVLKRFVERVGSEGIAVSYNPADLIINGFDHKSGLESLRPWTVHACAKDAKSGTEERPALEVPLGKGDADIPAYVKRLIETDYHGFLTVKREKADDPIAEIERDIKYLKQRITPVEKPVE